MSFLDPTPDAPSVVLRYHEARRRWQEVEYQAFKADREPQDHAFAAYAHADMDLAEAIQARGGRWDVGGNTYRLANGGILIERVVENSMVAPVII